MTEKIQGEWENIINDEVNKLVVPTPPIPPTPPENPNWIEWPEQRQTPDVGPVVTDVDRHINNNVYRDNDKITWTHETTHGINSLIRNKYNKPGFYVLNNKAYLLNEPKTTLKTVGSTINEVFRKSTIYSLYCVQAQHDWNNQPSYLIDEWSAYTNGTEARKALGMSERAETARFMLDMAIFCTYIPFCTKTVEKDLQEFLKYMWERTLSMLEDKSVLTILQSSSAKPIDELRMFMINYFGGQWTMANFRF